MLRDSINVDSTVYRHFLFHHEPLDASPNASSIPLSSVLQRRLIPASEFHISHRPKVIGDKLSSPNVLFRDLV